ncbi:TRAP transporter small permease [Pirellulimonas nuda]|nr:TRAP transporter small permease [Pirellulimonas nuda]
MMQSFFKLSDAVQRLLELLVILLVLTLVGDVLWGVAARFGSHFGLSPSLWTEELARLLLIWVTFLGAAVGFARREHLGLDYFANKLHPDARRTLACVSELIVIAFAATALVYGGMVLVRETLGAGQFTPALQLKMGYVYLAAPIAGACIILFGLKRLLELIFHPAPMSQTHDVETAARLD